MKQFHIVFFFLFIAINAYSQNASNEAPVNKYQQSLNEKEDFWSKLKGVFKPKKDRKTVQRTSDPDLVANDPNRTVRRVKKDRGNTINDYNEDSREKPSNPVNEDEGGSVGKKKKTLSQFWNELVNGKGYLPTKDYGGVRRKQKQQDVNLVRPPEIKKGSPIIKKNEIVSNKNNSNQNAPNRFEIAERELKNQNAKPIVKKTEKANQTKRTEVPVVRSANANKVSEGSRLQNPRIKASETQAIATKSLAENLVNPNDSKPLLVSAKPVAELSNPISKATVAPVKPAIAVKSNIESKVTTSKAAEVSPKAVAELKPTVIAEAKPKVVAEFKPKALAEVKPNVIAEAKPKAVEEVKPKAAEVKPNVIAEAKPKTAAEVKPKIAADIKPKVVTEAKPKVIVPAVVDNTIRNEIQPLSLTRTASGMASYFFSGGSFGKFYVVTNVAMKGEVIKVINTQNGKSLLAEVMDGLPSSDLKRGLLLKISDNAKLPLGQNNKSFSVKVNY